MSKTMAVPVASVALAPARRLIGLGARGRQLSSLDTGRTCPPHYGYGPARLAACPTVPADTLFCVGGLYGNLQALDAVEARVRADPGGGSVRVVFNGDFNFFNATPAAWDEINTRVSAWEATLGNVEFEAAMLGGAELSHSGCGCAYPEYVDDSVVERANAIVSQLRTAASSALPRVRSWLSQLPMYAAYQVGGARVAVVHGDALALAGWGLAVEQLDVRRVSCWLDRANADIFASTHTCTAHAHAIPRSCAPSPASAAGAHAPLGAVFNNGAAGIPNFECERAGLMTRISADWTTVPEDAVYGLALPELGVRADAIPVAYDHERWLACFERWWPPGSAGHAGYAARIERGLTGWRASDAAPKSIDAALADVCDNGSPGALPVLGRADGVIARRMSDDY